MAEGSRSHGGQGGVWCSEVDRRRRPESAGGCAGVQEFKELQGSEVVGLKGKEQNCVIYPQH